MHPNFKLVGFTGIFLTKALWAAAKATTFNQFVGQIEELKKVDVATFGWLNEKPPIEWSRSHFTFGPKCDTLLNNMCECFNIWFLHMQHSKLLNLLIKHLNSLIYK